MIIKELKKPIILRKLEALLLRLPVNHPKRSEIEGQLANRFKGYRGEMALHYPFSYLTKDKYQIMYTLRLWDGAHFFQMDTLLLSTNYLLIIEVKNLSGTIVFDQNFKQMIRITGDKEEAFEDPLLQVARHKHQLQEWLKHKKLPRIPIETLVVFSNPHTLLKSTGPGLGKKVTHISNLIPLIKDFEKYYKSEVMTSSQLKKLARLMLKNNDAGNPDVLKWFKIQKDELIRGTQCPVCLYTPMARYHHGWKCVHCEHYSTIAHLTAIEHYVLLIGQELTNKDIKEFLVLSSTSAAKRVLLSLNATHIGTTKSRKYFIPLD
ncbi:Nuclease-related domain-containing protein [Bacillus sp. OV194]|nr:Nuclease-related domain-containing protein [Bacillus sp. OV194]